MRKVLGLVTAVIILLGAAGAAAEQTVRLPESRYAVTMPDGMTYDGPTPDSDEAFAYVYEEIGLEAGFFRYEGEGTGLTDVITKLLAGGAEDIRMTTVNGVEMLAFRYAPVDESGMKGVGYVLQDGDATLEILFWYATQEAADLTKTIMESIGETETV